MAPSSTYSVAMVKEKSVARSPNARADKVNGQYLTKARKLDTECFSSEPDVEARPVLRKLRSYPRVRGQCVGAFAECSSDIHLLLQDTRGGQVRSHTLLAPSWGRFCGGGGRDLLG